jgi:hypothetical protein
MLLPLLGTSPVSSFPLGWPNVPLVKSCESTYVLFRSCEYSWYSVACQGQAADVLASTTRSSATGSTLKAPLKLGQVPQWGSAWPFGPLPEKRGFARHVPSPCFTEIDLHEKSGGVPDTDPHPRKKKRIKEQRSKATVRAPRRSHAVRPARVLQSMGKLNAGKNAN